MIDWMFAIFLLMAFLLIVLIIQYHDDVFWGAMFTILDIVMWFVLAASVLEIEAPTFMYNSTIGAYEPVLKSFYSVIAPELLYFFYMMAIIMVIFFVGYFMFAPLYKVVTGKKFERKKKEG